MDRLLEDGFGRRFRYLRLSVTEVCNFRCTYCLPNGYRKNGAQDFLRPDEISRVARAFANAGARKVRLTGGEPSVRKDLSEIIGRVADAGAEKVALTTNGWNLLDRIGEWRSAGLTHLNVSVDSLDPRTFAELTGHDRLNSILRGVDRAIDLDVRRVKLNAVMLARSVNGAFEAFACLLRDRPITARFIELMRTGDNAEYFDAQHVGGGILKNWLQERGWTRAPRSVDDGPAMEYFHPDYTGRFGVIAPYAPGFCDSCNRLRVTARGRLRLCLFGTGGLDLRDLLQDDADELALVERINAALSGKAAGHRLHAGDFGNARNLSQMGG